MLTSACALGLPPGRGNLSLRAGSSRLMARAVRLI